jgi:exodeoxyribonuclease VIII
MRYRNPLRPLETSSTDAMETGTLMHCAIGEPHEFLKIYSAGPDVSKATTQWKEFASEAKSEGRIPIKRKEWQAAVDCADSVRSHPVARKILEHPSLRTEVSATWSYELDGGQVDCRGRADILMDWCLADLKTSSRGEPEDFRWQAEKYSYHTQAAFYQAGFRKALGANDNLPFFFIVFDATYPYKCYVYRATDEFLERGRHLFSRWICEYHQCSTTGVWPAYNESLIELTPPPNAKWRDNDE